MRGSLTDALHTMMFLQTFNCHLRVWDHATTAELMISGATAQLLACEY